jgi:hypothetical protein
VGQSTKKAKGASSSCCAKGCPGKGEVLGKNSDLGWVPVAHICNPSYSGGRDQEDGGLKPALANSSQDPVSKYLSQKRADGVAWRCRTRVQIPVPQEKKKEF